MGPLVLRLVFSELYPVINTHRNPAGNMFTVSFYECVEFFCQRVDVLLKLSLFKLSPPERSTQQTMQNPPRQRKATEEAAAPGTTRAAWSRRRDHVSPFLTSDLMSVACRWRLLQDRCASLGFSDGSRSAALCLVLLHSDVSVSDCVFSIEDLWLAELCF